ncbi:MAG TPA: GDSL-type esterase/lipase family protein [Longimicrobiales bacterium]|nr:GDSL-type esterase/lipase family protein [Longimicrobiales bacterium]
MYRDVLLIGDSILDNQPYTRPSPDTATHLREVLGEGWTVDLLARDGAVMSEIPEQLQQVKSRDACAFVSIGGNDLTRHLSLLDRPAASAMDLLGALLDIAEEFSASYEAVARAVTDRVARTVLCTIYEVQLEPPPFAELARVPLGVMNDRIIRTAARLGLEVLELRDVCTEPGDFVMQIEPSAQGARRIADAIAEVLRDDATTAARIHSTARTRASRAR